MHWIQRFYLSTYLREEATYKSRKGEDSSQYSVKSEAMSRHIAKVKGAEAIQGSRLMYIEQKRG